MRSLAVTLCLLLVLFVAVGANAVYVNRVCEKMLSSAERLEEDGYSEEEFERLSSVWERSRELLSLSVSSDELWQMEELISSLPSLSTSPDELVSNCRLIRRLCYELARYERISLESIL